MIDGQRAGAEGEVVADDELRAAIGGDTGGEVVPGVERDVGVAVDDRLVVVSIAANIANEGTDLDGGGSGEHVFKGTGTELNGALVATAAEAIDAIGGGTEGRGEVELVDRAAGHGPEPEVLDGTALIEGRFHRADVEGTILDAVVEGDDTEGGAGGVQLDLAIGGTTGGEQAEDVRLGERSAVVVEADGHTGIAPGVAVGGDFLTRDVCGIGQADEGAGEEIDVAHTKGSACAENGGADEAGGGVLGGGPDFEAGLTGEAKGIGRVQEEETAVAGLDQLATDIARTADDAFEDALVGRTEGGVDEGGVGTEAGGAGDGEAVLDEIEVDRRVGPEIGNRQIVDPLHDALVVVRDAGIRIDEDVAADVAGDTDATGDVGVATCVVGEQAVDDEHAADAGVAVEDDVASVGGAGDGGTRVRDRVLEEESALIDGDVAGEAGVAGTDKELRSAELGQAAAAGDLGVDDGIAAGVDHGLTRAEGEGHGKGDGGHGGGCGLHGADGRRAGEEQPPKGGVTTCKGDGVEGGGRGDVTTDAGGVGVDVHPESLGGGDVDHAACARIHADGAGGDVVNVAVTELAGAGSDCGTVGGCGLIAQQRLEAAVGHAEGVGGAVGDEGVILGINDPRGDDAASGDPGTKQRGAGPRWRGTGNHETGEGSRSERATVVDDTHGAGLCRACCTDEGERGVADQERAIGAANESAGRQGHGACTGGAVDLDGGALASGQNADLLEGLRIGHTDVTEDTAIDVLTGGIRPAALAVGNRTELVLNGERAAGAELDDVVVGVGAGVIEGRAVQAAGVAQCQGAIDFDGAAAQRGGGGTGVESDGGALADGGAAVVVVGVAEDHATVAVGDAAALKVGELAADDDASRSSAAGGAEDVIGADEGKVRAVVGTEAVGIARADAEGRGEVLDFIAAVTAEEGGAVAEAGHVQRGVEGRNGELEGGSEAAVELDDGVQTSAWVVVGVEDEGRQAVDVAIEVQGGDAAEAAIARDAEGRAEIDTDDRIAAGSTERGAGGASDLKGTGLDVGATGVGVGSAGDAHGAEAVTADFVQRTRAGDRSGQVEVSRGTGDGGEVRVSATEGGGASDSQTVAVVTGEDEGVVGDGEVADLDLVSGVGTHAVHVHGCITGHGKVETVGGRVAEDDGAVGAAAVAVEAEFTTLEGDSAGSGAIGTAEGQRILGDEDALIDGDATGEAVLAGEDVVGRDVAQGQGAGAALDQCGGASAVDDVPEEGGAGRAADGQAAGGGGGIRDHPGGAGEAGDSDIGTVEVQGAGVVEHQPGGLLRGGRAAEAEDAVVHGERAVDAVAAREGEGACAGLGEGSARDATADGANNASVSADIDDAFADLRGDGGIHGQSDVWGRGGGCGADGNARAAGDGGNGGSKRDARTGNRLSDDESGGSRNRDGGRGVRGSSGEADRGGQTVEDHVGTDRAGVVEDQGTHVVGVHGAEAQGAAVDSSRGSEAENVSRAGDAGGRGDVGDGGRGRARKRVGQGGDGIGGDEAQDGIIGDKAGGLIRAGSEAQDGASGGIDIVAGEAADVVERGELLRRGGHLTEDGATEDAGVRANGVAEVTVRAGNNDQGARTDTSEGGGGELDVIAHHGIEAHVGATGEVHRRNREGGTGAVGVHAEGTAVDRHCGIAKRSAGGGLGQQSSPIADGREIVCVGTGLVSIEDDGAWAVEGQEGCTGGEGVVCVGLAGGCVDAARGGHGDDAVGGLAGGYGELTTTKGDAAGKDVESSRASEVGVGADAEDTSVDGGGTQVGVRSAEHQGAQAGLGEAGLRTNEGEVAADDTAGRRPSGRTHVNGAALDQLHVVGDREVPVPTGERAGVQQEIAGKIAGGAEGEDALADGGVGVGVGGIAQAQDARAGFHQGGGPGNDTGEGDDARGIGHKEGTIGRAREIHGPAEAEISLTEARADDAVGGKGADGIARAGEGAEHAGAGEVDVVGDIHRRQEGHVVNRITNTGLIALKSAAIERNRAGAERTRVADLNDGVAVNGGAARVGVRCVENDRAAVADEVGPRSAGDRADDDGVGSGEDRGVDLKGAAAGAEAVGGTRACAEGGGVVVTTRGGTEEDAVVGSHRTEVDCRAVADHVDRQCAVHGAAGGGEGDAAWQCSIVTESDGTDAVVVGVHRGGRAADVGGAEDAEGRAGIHRDGASGGELLVGRSAAADASFDLSLVNNDIASVGRSTAEDEVSNALLGDGWSATGKSAEDIQLVKGVQRGRRGAVHGEGTEDGGGLATLSAKGGATCGHGHGADGTIANRGVQDAIGTEVDGVLDEDVGGTVEVRTAIEVEGRARRVVGTAQTILGGRREPAVIDGDRSGEVGVAGSTDDELPSTGLGEGVEATGRSKGGTDRGADATIAREVIFDVDGRIGGTKGDDTVQGQVLRGDT